MKNMTLLNIAKACGGTLVNGGDEKEIAGAVLDSRLVEKDYLFFATRGERVDGHSFIGQVFEKGAMAVVCEEVTEELKERNLPYILVENSFDALKRVAMFYREQLEIPVIGITGSVGKTSTKEFVAGVLGEKWNVLKTQGNFNNEVGVPLTLLKIREEHEIAVVEMGISDFGEMHRLSEIVKPNVCVMTNIGQCHLENLISREGVLRAKSEIFDFIHKDGIVVLNQDDDMLATIEEVAGKKPLSYGTAAGADCYMTDVYDKGIYGSGAMFHMAGESFEVSVKLPGVHMLYNAMAATLVGTHFGLSISEITKGILGVQPVGGRSHLIECDHYSVLDDCYNANPVSMKAAIDLLKTATGRKVAILGDMFELGVEEENLHSEIGIYATKTGVDVLICVGKLSKNMYDAAVLACEEMRDEVNMELYYFETREQLLSSIMGEDEGFVNSDESIIKLRDTILVKASHSMGFALIVEKLCNK